MNSNVYEVIIFIKWPTLLHYDSAHSTLSASFLWNKNWVANGISIIFLKVYNLLSCCFSKLPEHFYQQVSKWKWMAII